MRIMGPLVKRNKTASLTKLGVEWKEINVKYTILHVQENPILTMLFVIKDMSLCHRLHIYPRIKHLKWFPSYDKCFSKEYVIHLLKQTNALMCDGHTVGNFLPKQSSAKQQHVEHYLRSVNLSKTENVQNSTRGICMLLS